MTGNKVDGVSESVRHAQVLLGETIFRPSHFMHVQAVGVVTRDLAEEICTVLGCAVGRAHNPALHSASVDGEDGLLRVFGLLKCDV